MVDEKSERLNAAIWFNQIVGYFKATDGYKYLKNDKQDEIHRMEELINKLLK